jgi:hypothetical protein
VNQSIPPYVTVSGEKAKARGVNTEGLRRRGYSAEQIQQVRRAYKILYRSGKTMDEAREELNQMAQTSTEIKALEQDGTMWDYAFDKRVLLATPTNLIAIARTVAAVWRQEKLAKEARQIGELGKELYDRLAKAAGDLRKVGAGLTSAVNNYNNFVSSFESRSLVTARKFRDLNIEPGAREIEMVPPVEALARYGDDNRPEADRPVDGPTRPILPPPSANEDDAAA